MVKFTTQETTPIHVENTILRETKKDLSIDNAFRTFHEMGFDPIVSGSMLFIKSVLAKKFKIKYHAESTTREKAVIDALNTSLDNLAPYDLKRFMYNVLSCLEYGSSLQEMVFERVDGYQVFKGFSPIHLSTVNRFQFNRGELEKVILDPAENDGLIERVEEQQKEIEGSKLLLFSIQPSQDSPLGQSLLKGCYTAWKEKAVYREYSLIGTAKNLSGVLSISLPSEYITKYLTVPASDEAVYVDSLLQQAEMMHAGKSSYVVTPSDVYEGGQAQFQVDTIGGDNSNDYSVNDSIDRCNKEIQLSLQSMLLSLGQEGGGSFALSESKTYLLTLFAKSIQDSIAGVFKKAIRTAFELNGITSRNIPDIEFEEIEDVDWDTFTSGWQRLLTAGGVNPGEKLEDFFREKGGAPSSANDQPRLEDIR